MANAAASVSLKGKRELEVAVDCGGGDVKRVGGMLRKAVKGFGSGSVWELVPEGDGKVRGQSALLDACMHVWSGTCMLDLHLAP